MRRATVWAALGSVAIGWRDGVGLWDTYFGHTVIVKKDLASQSEADQSYPVLRVHPGFGTTLTQSIQLRSGDERLEQSAGYSYFISVVAGISEKHGRRE